MTQQQLEEEEEEALGDYEVLRYGHHEVMTASGNTYHVKTFFGSKWESMIVRAICVYAVTYRPKASRLC
jgi:hypothetical protein